MAVDPTEAIRTAQRYRQDARRSSEIELCDLVIGLAMAKGAVVKAVVARPSVGICPICEARRKAKALAMRKWRRRQGRV